MKNKALEVDQWMEISATARNENFIVELSWIGEGRDGDYDKEDPDDVPLLRMDVTRADGEEMDRASYCTAIPASCGSERAQQLVGELLAAVNDGLASDSLSGGRFVAGLSWMDERGMLSLEARRASL